MGELNGLRGWFPAKFVELLDERSKFYTSAGDDTVTGQNAVSLPLKKTHIAHII